MRVNLTRLFYYGIPRTRPPELAACPNDTVSRKAAYLHEHEHACLYTCVCVQNRYIYTRACVCVQNRYSSTQRAAEKWLYHSWAARWWDYCNKRSPLHWLLRVLVILLKTFNHGNKSPAKANYHRNNPSIVESVTCIDSTYWEICVTRK
jgi:hypothetical protein